MPEKKKSSDFCETGITIPFSNTFYACINSNYDRCRCDKAPFLKAAGTYFKIKDVEYCCATEFGKQAIERGHNTVEGYVGKGLGVQNHPTCDPNPKKDATKDCTATVKMGTVITTKSGVCSTLGACCLLNVMDRPKSADFIEQTACTETVDRWDNELYD